MNNFDEQLLRLKQAVKLTEDQDVAALLGMTKAAFSGRKKRGVFPEDKLFALATRRPDLHLDVLYVLAGDKKDAAVQITIAELEAALTYEADKGGTISEQMKRAAEFVKHMHASLLPDEQMWLDCYREWDTPTKKRELRRAVGVLSEGAAASPQAAAPRNTVSIGRVQGANQITSGVLHNHGPMTFGVAPPTKAKKTVKS